MISLALIFTNIKSCQNEKLIKDNRAVIEHQTEVLRFIAGDK
jgi:hypothetical protein